MTIITVSTLRRAAALAAAVLFFCLPVRGQERPDAGSIQRELQRPSLETPRAAPRIPAETARAGDKADTGQRFIVSALNISGNTAFPSEVLLALIRDQVVGKTVTLARLQEEVTKISEFYRAHGYPVARAYIPAQRISAGGAEVQIVVLEGVLGEVEVENHSRLSDAAVARFIEPLKPGQPLALAVLERPVLLLSDQAGVGGVSPAIKPGAGTGSSDLAIELAPSPTVSGLIAADNYGNRFTGRDRISGQINLFSAFGSGELLNADFTQSTEGGLAFAGLHGELPVGGDGWRIGASYSHTDYELGEDFAALEASGSARAAGVFARYPLVRSQDWNLNVTLARDENHFEDEIVSTGSVIPKQTHLTSVSLGGDVRDPFVRNSVLVWNATVTAGDVSIDEANARQADAATAKTRGGYQKYRLALLYLQAFNRDWSLYANLEAQGADKNLDSSEKFFLGGAQGVRAYPLGEAAGDVGALATLELRYTLPQWMGATPSLVLFTDQGYVDINKHPFTDGDNDRTLGAAGIGFILEKNRSFSLHAYWADSTTGGPAAADTGHDNRAWLQAVKYF